MKRDEIAEAENDSSWNTRVNMQSKVRDWMRAFGQETPDKLCVPNFETLRLRAALELEETFEKICKGFGLTVCIKAGDDRVLISKDNLKNQVEIRFASFDEPDLTEVRDGSADQKFVIYGSDVAFGIDSEEDFENVVRSNFSKMWTTNEIRENQANFPDNITLNEAFKSDDDTVRRWIVKDGNGKVIKSPSYSPAKFKPHSYPCHSGWQRPTF